MENDKARYLIDMINKMDIKDKLRLAIYMSQSEWSGFMYNTKENYKKFDKILKDIDENGVEFWYARELMKVLSYKDWRYFDAVIEKAKIACQNSELSAIDHFVVDNKMVEIGFGAKREQ